MVSMASIVVVLLDYTIVVLAARVPLAIVRRLQIRSIRRCKKLQLRARIGIRGSRQTLARNQGRLELMLFVFL